VGVAILQIEFSYVRFALVLDRARYLPPRLHRAALRAISLIAIGPLTLVMLPRLGVAQEVRSAARASDSASVLRSARPAIDSANAAWLPAMEREDAAAIAAPYSDDAVFVTASGVSVRGRAAVERLMRERFPQMGRVVGGRLVQDGLTIAGSLIYEWGHADLELVRGAAPPVRSAGRYLTVWSRDASGHWRITRNLSLPD